VRLLISTTLPLAILRGKITHLHFNYSPEKQFAKSGQVPILIQIKNLWQIVITVLPGDANPAVVQHLVPLTPCSGHWLQSDTGRDCVI